MSKRSARKGRDGELEYAKLSKGVRISVKGLPGADVRDGDGILVEVKRRVSLPGELEAWLAQMEREGAKYIAVRADRGRWVKIEYITFEGEDTS